MKIKGQKLFSVYLWVILLGFLAGCAIPQKQNIADSALDYNLVAEKAQNSTLLLNIVRASERRPMLFTTLSLLRGEMGYSFGTGSLSIPFGGNFRAANSVYSIAPNAGYSTKPSFDIAVLNNDQKFMRGITTPVPMETLDYYWQQGWPKEMLMNIFVRRIEINGKILDNYPGNKDKLTEFQNFLREPGCKLVIEKRSKPFLLGPKINAEKLTDIEQLIGLNKAGLELKKLEKTEDKEFYQLSGEKSEYVFSLVHDKGSETPPEEGKLYLRSPEAMLYYLGEILRAGDEQKGEGGVTPTIQVCKSGPSVPLFVARRATNNDKDAPVRVDYEGVEYVIPNEQSSDACSAPRSMHVLSLISLLFAQQISSADLPVTGTVNIIGR